MREFGRFQSTRPSRGATWPLERGGVAVPDFNPRAPRGARRFEGRAEAVRQNISIHAPLAGRDHSTS